MSNALFAYRLVKYSIHKLFGIMTSSANISIFCEKVKTVGIEILYYYHIGLPSAKLGKFNTL